MLIHCLVVQGILHPLRFQDDGWPRTGVRCPVDGQRLLYTVHGDGFYCENEEDEHFFITTLRGNPGRNEPLCNCCPLEG